MTLGIQHVAVCLQVREVPAALPDHSVLMARQGLHREALSQLVAVDLAYLGAIAAVNFLFPYVLIPVALNPAQLLVLPSDAPPPPPPQRIADGQADAAK